MIDTDNASDLNAANLAQADVALEFTMPTTAYGNIRTCIENATPVVSGTTGWTDRLPELQELCREKGGALFYASNYCLGVNLMFRLNRQLAEVIGRVGRLRPYASGRYTTPRRRMRRAVRPSRWPRASSPACPPRRSG